MRFMALGYIKYYMNDGEYHAKVLISKYKIRSKASELFLKPIFLPISDLISLIDICPFTGLQIRHLLNVKINSLQYFLLQTK